MPEEMIYNSNYTVCDGNEQCNFRKETSKKRCACSVYDKPLALSYGEEIQGMSTLHRTVQG